MFGWQEFSSSHLGENSFGNPAFYFPAFYFTPLNLNQLKALFPDNSLIFMHKVNRLFTIHLHPFTKEINVLKRNNFCKHCFM